MTIRLTLRFRRFLLANLRLVKIDMECLTCITANILGAEPYPNHADCHYKFHKKLYKITKMIMKPYNYWTRITIEK